MSRWDERRWVRVGTDTAGNPQYNRSGTSTSTLSSYEDWTKDELQAELVNRGLPKTGNKDDLIARLRESDRSL